MICIIPDTNILLNTIKGNYDGFQFLNALQTLVVSEKLVLAIPEQVKAEWERHRDDIVEGAKVTLKADIDKAKKLKLFVLPQSSDGFVGTIERLESELDRMINHRITRKVMALNDLVNNHSVIIPTTDDHKILAADWALDKMAPFFGSKDKQDYSAKDEKRKNSMADAIIFQCAVDHISSNAYTKAYFVTENYSDFSKSGNKKELHENLSKLVPEGFCYETNMPKFFYEITQSTGFKTYTYEESVEMEKRIQEVANREEWGINHPNDTIICPRCQTTLDDKKDGHWHHSMYGGGLSWWRTCPKCRLRWDTGEYFDY